MQLALVAGLSNNCDRFECDIKLASPKMYMALNAVLS